MIARIPRSARPQPRAVWLPFVCQSSSGMCPGSEYSQFIHVAAVALLVFAELHSQALLHEALGYPHSVSSPQVSPSEVRVNPISDAVLLPAVPEPS